MTTAELHRCLNEKGYDISKRSVQRDLDLLSEWAELDYEDTREGKTWFLDTRKSGKLDVMQPDEAFMLVLSERLLARVMPREYLSKLENRLKKAKAMLATRNQLARWQEKLSVVSDTYPLIHDQSDIDEDDREIIYECVQKEQKVKIHYQAKDKPKPVEFVLNPLGLIIRDQSHYLVATKDSDLEKPLLFLFHRILDAEKEYQDITKPRTFSIQEYFAKKPSGWVFSDQPCRIKLKVKGYALDVLEHNQLGDEQVLEQGESGWATVCFTTVPTYDLVAWILRYGNDVICVEPESLRDKVTSTLESALNNYD